MDKDATCIEGLAALGFGFIEVGTVTPKPQAGNPRPRLFRLHEDDALVNRMGFNNQGMDAMARSLTRTTYTGILGINIGKNRDTPVERALAPWRWPLPAARTDTDHTGVVQSSSSVKGHSWSRAHSR